MACLLLNVLPGASLPAGAASTVRLLAAGDFWYDSTTRAVLNTMQGAGAAATLALGDFTHTDVPEADWCSMVRATMGSTYPFELVSGNHESNGADGLIDTFAGCLPNRIAGMQGTYGREYFFDLPQQQPLVRVIMASPNLSFTTGRWDYSKGSSHYVWLASAIDTARAAGIPNVIVATHYPCLTIGNSTTYATCPMQPDVANLLLAKRVDLVVNAHDHTYQRTHQLALRTGCSSLDVRATDADCIVDKDNTFTKGAGTVFAVVGTGGGYRTDLLLGDARRGYFAALSGKNLNQATGALQIDVSSTGITATFLPAGGATFSDRFQIGSSTPPAPPAGTSVLVAQQSSWRWRYSDAALPSSWTSPGFDDSGWLTGTAPLGFGYTSLGTDIMTAPALPNPRPRSLQVRRSFSVANPAAYSSLTLATRADDGVVVYLNGTEVARRNMPSGAVSISTYPTAAPSSPVSVTVAVPVSLLRSGTNTIVAFTNLNYRATPNVSFEAQLTGSLK